MDRKSVVRHWEGELGPHITQCGQAEAYLHATFNIYPSNRLATIDQRYGQDRTDSTDNGPIAYGEPFYKRWPKNLSVLAAYNFTTTNFLCLLRVTLISTMEKKVKQSKVYGIRIGLPND